MQEEGDEKITPDRPRAVRPLVGLHSGFLWYDNAFGLADREFVEDRSFAGESINRGVPIGIDAGVGVAISDRAYLLTYLTGQMLLVSISECEVMERDPFCDIRPHSGAGDPCMRALEGDGFGFPWGVRAGIGIRL